MLKRRVCEPESGTCVSGVPLCPLLTFVTTLTSAHSLLSTGQDPRCVNNADTLQNLVGHLGTLKPGIYIINQKRSRINANRTEVHKGQAHSHCCCKTEGFKSCEKLLTFMKEVSVIEGADWKQPSPHPSPSHCGPLYLSGPLNTVGFLMENGHYCQSQTMTPANDI